MLVSLLLADYSPWLLLAAGSAGNVLGSTINWLLGRAIDRYGSSHRWFREDKLDRARGWYHRYGRWSLLLSWAPVIGDPLTIVAGVMRERLAVFLLFVTIAKVARYTVVIAVTRWVS
ncbi:MAG: DedA family protein [Enhydrobacter sp.]|nr:DedA family protein [Enhydrobacter sp.]